MNNNLEVDRLFKQLDNELADNVDRQYFQEPREFRSLIEVLAVLNEQVDQMNRHQELGSDLSTVLKEDTHSHSKLDHQLVTVKRIIEEIVSFQQGGLNNSLDTMSEVIKEYNRSRDEIQTLRKSLVETQTVLTAKKSGQISLKELWGRRVELKESLRMVRELEEFKNFPLKANRLIQQRRYLTTAKQLQDMLDKIFSDDFNHVGGLVHIREQFFTLKERLLENCVEELKESILHFQSSQMIENTFEEIASLSDDDVASEINGGGSVRSFSRTATINRGAGGGDETASVGSSNRRPSFLGQSVPSSVTSLFSQMNSNSDYWSYNLRDVDEALESNLIDPSSTGPLFIRLLVKTVNHLNFENDVEQLLEETILAGFQQAILPRVKLAAQAKLTRTLQQHPPASSASSTSVGGIGSPIQDEDLRLNSKLFNEYVYLLLEMILGIFQRTIYVYKLLSYSKYLHNHPSTNAVVGSSTVGGGYHSDYLSAETQRKIITTLSNVILQIEEFIQQEMEIHLVEADVQNISDTTPANKKTSSGSGRGAKTGQGAGGNDDEEDEGTALRDRPIFRSSVWHAAFLYSNIYKYNYKLYKLLTDNFDEEPILSVMMNSSSPLSAEYEETHYYHHQNRQSTHHATPITGASGGGRMTITGFTSSLLPFIRGCIETEFIPVVQSWVNQELRDLMEIHSIENLNSVTAAAMIEQRHKLFYAKLQAKQNDNQQQQHQLAISTSTMMIHVVYSTCHLLLKLWYQLFDHRDFLVVVYDRLLKTVSSMVQENEEYLMSTFNVITYLAKISFHPFLIRDWNYNLHKQRAMAGHYQSLLEIFSKIQMNIASSDQLLTPNFPTFQTNTSSSSSSSSSMSTPSTVSAINGSNYHQNNPLNPLSSSYNNPSNQGQSISSRPIDGNGSSNANASEQELHQVYVDEFATLQRAFKELQGLPLPKFQPDNNMIGVFGILSHDSDWLVRKLLNLCLQIVKKGNSISNIYLSSSSSSSSSYASNSATTNQTNSSNNNSTKLQSFKNIRQNLLESKKTLITTTLENLQKIQNHAETSLSMLRKVLQILSFYQVNGLVTTFYDYILQPNKTSFSEEGTVSIFLTPISNMIEILAEILPTILLISTIGPIITTLPRIFLRGIVSPFLSGQASAALLDNTGSGGNSPITSSGASNGTRISLIKSCLLRLAVTMQQQLLILIQSVMDKEIESRRKITDICSEEFERIRRYIAMIDTPATEIQAFIQTYGREFMEDEFTALRMLSSRLT